MLPKKIVIPGFQFAGLHCGIKDNSRKKDLALIYSEEPNTLIDGVFTKNKVFAAPVAVCREVVAQGRGRLIVINSGVANACTGAEGLKNAQKTQSAAAKVFGLNPKEVLVCSTGKIGVQLPMKALIPGLEKAKLRLGANHFIQATHGIMTTDQYPKFGSVTGRIGGKKFTLAVLAKGAGMLRPDMATMLAYAVTDLKMTAECLRAIFRNAVDQTLNRITVDGDMSTNDTVIMMANGRAGNPVFDAFSPAGIKVQKMLTHLLESMARKIALDGEGATKCCDVKVEGAVDQEDAKKIAYAIGNSPLVKTALFGCDPNWGRIMAAVGYSGAAVDPNKIGIRIGSTWVAKKGRGVPFNPSQVSRYMKNQHIEMRIQCGVGSGRFHVYMSDLTYDYIHLNAEYHT